MEQLSDLGEFGLINRFKQNTLKYHPETHLGIGDDAAVIDLGHNFGLLSSDFLLEGVHFDLTYTPIKHLGYKLVSIGVSDIAAMNGIPKQVTINIAPSNRFGLADIDELYAGIHLACEDYNVDLVGGDTSTSRAGLLLSVTAFGTVAKDKIVYRTGAKPNDILCVTGDLGAAYMGLQVLEREKQEFLANPAMKPNIEDKSILVGKQLKPNARLDVIHDLAELGIVPTTMIDLSDGLASDLLQLAKANNLGYSVFFENVPIENQTLETCTEFNLNPIASIMHGGDDYELLFTITQEDFEKAKKITDISFIGYVTENNDNWLVLNSGEKTKITAQGWPNG
jgi:thiamine-monophosphate kinase